MAWVTNGPVRFGVGLQGQPLYLDESRVSYIKRITDGTSAGMYINGNLVADFFGSITRVPSTATLQLAERTAPSNPGTDQARLYAVDNGAGKTQLVVIFQSGSGIVLATEA